MRIYVPNSTPAHLATNGIGNILCESALVHEEVNGEFSLKIKVSEKSDHLDDVVIGAIVKADTPRGKQLFRLSKPIETLDGGKEVFAWHISQDLAQDMILDRGWTGKTGSEALPSILQAGISETRFTGTSDISLVTNMRIVRTSVLGAIIGEQDNSFINRWGGEIERDNFTVNVLSRLGADKGVIIEYCKNLTGLAIEEDDDQVANRIIPTGLNENDTVIMLPEVYIDSDLIGDTPIPHVRHVHFSDVKVGAKDEDDNVVYPNVTSVRNELRARVAQMYEQGADIPLKSIIVEFIDLSQTEEYKDYAVLETVEIGDTVKVKSKNKELSRRVVSYDYNSLTKKYIKVVLGGLVPTLGDSLWTQDIDLSALRNDFSNTVKQGDVYNGCYVNHADGFVTVAEIGGKTIRTKQNSQDGFGIYDGSTFIGGVRIVGGKAAFVGNVLTNDVNGDCYAEIGSLTISGHQRSGVGVYHKEKSTTTPSCFIAVDHSGSVELYCPSSGSGFFIGGGSGNILAHFGTPGVRTNRFGIGAEVTSLLSQNLQSSLDLQSGQVLLRHGTNYLGIDAGGVYKQIGGGSKVYL